MRLCCLISVVKILISFEMENYIFTKEIEIIASKQLDYSKKKKSDFFLSNKRNLYFLPYIT